MIDFRLLMSELAQERPIFHSEADFQHALAWLIQRKFPHAQIRLEYPFDTDAGRIYVDIWVTLDGKHYTIELKYKTASFETIVGSEAYRLRNHGAQDEGRYDYLFDVKRLEEIPFCKGIAILLTNDTSYWRDSMRSTSNATNFRLSHNYTVSGNLEWLWLTPNKPTKRDASISLSHTYLLQWQDYSNLGEWGHFKYLMLEVPEANS